MSEEMKALEKNMTLGIINPQEGKKIVGLWIFTINYRPDGTFFRKIEGSLRQMA